MNPVEEAWGRVEADWANEEAHRKFVGVCVALGQLPEAGKRYREVRERDPERRQDAIARIEKLLTLATQQLEDTKVPPSTTEHKRTLQWIAFAIMMLFMTAGVWLMLRG